MRVPRRGRWRTALVRRLPVPLMEYPFECFIAVYAFLAAVVVTVGGEGLPLPLRHVVPPVVVLLWGLSLGLGAATVGLGLRRRWRLALPIGLRLVAACLGILAAVAGYLDHSLPAIPGLILILFVATLAAARSLYLRAATEVRHRARIAKEAP